MTVFEIAAYLSRSLQVYKTSKGGVLSRQCN